MKPDALWHDYQTIERETSMTDQNRRMRDHLPEQRIDWERGGEPSDEPIRIERQQALLNCAAALLKAERAPYAAVALPGSDPQKFIMIGTTDDILRLLPIPGATDGLLRATIREITALLIEGQDVDHLFNDPDLVRLLSALTTMAVRRAATPARASQAVSPERLTNEEIDLLWESMPGGPAQFMKTWGYQTFAKNVEEEVISNLTRNQDALSAPSALAKLVPLEPTEAMMDAAEACSADWPRTTWKAAWTAMLAAAPALAGQDWKAPAAAPAAAQAGLAKLVRYHHNEHSKNMHDDPCGEFYKVDDVEALFATLAAPVAADTEKARPRIPQTAQEAIYFLNSHYESMEEADEPDNVRFQLTAHDLVTAFRWWFELGATPLATLADTEQATDDELDRIADAFKIEADADGDPELRAGGPKRLIAFDYFKRGWMRNQLATPADALAGEELTPERINALWREAESRYTAFNKAIKYDFARAIEREVLARMSTHGAPVTASTREAFEAWMRAEGWESHLERYNVYDLDDTRSYKNRHATDKWEGWEACAKFFGQSPAPVTAEPVAWQPIETVPKDMAARLYLVEGFCVQGFVDAVGELMVQSEVSPHWRKMRCKPTHWMPLPPKPHSDSASGRAQRTNNNEG